MATLANEHERAQVGNIGAVAQDATGDSIELANVDQGDTREDSALVADGWVSTLTWSICQRPGGA